MASYPAGTVFSSAQAFPSYTSFDNGCVFASGCTFVNPCYFGDGCVFVSGCSLLLVTNKDPPHETGDGCVFGPGCSLIYVRIGSNNIIESPSSYEPQSVGEGTVVDGPGTAWPTGSVQAPQCSDVCGQVISGTHVSKDWCQASNLKGFDAPKAKIEHPSICEKS